MTIQLNRPTTQNKLDQEPKLLLEFTGSDTFRTAILELLTLTLTEGQTSTCYCFVWTETSETSDLCFSLDPAVKSLKSIATPENDPFVESLKSTLISGKLVAPSEKGPFRESLLLKTPAASQNFSYYPFRSVEGQSLGGILMLGPEIDDNAPQSSRLHELVAGQIGRHIELEMMRMKYANLTVYLSKASQWKILAEFASGVAHELNNPLAILQSRLTRIVTLIESKQYKEDDMNKQLKSSLSVVDRMNRIIRGLRALARDGESLDFVPGNVYEILLDALGICDQKLKALEILMIKEIPLELSTICNPTQITQALVNLINNAMDVLKNFDGTREITAKAYSEGNWVHIEVSNTGPRIPEEIRLHIFDPFFSTKKAGEGLGLGLSITANIVKAHGGQIEALANTENTTFRISLPSKLI